MKLYGSYTSPYVRHCRIVLSQIGEDFEFIETDRAGSAIKSPTKRVPFLEDGNICLTDSSAIVKYLREKANTPFLPDIADYDSYCLTNTALDAAANVFFLELDGVGPAQSDYLKRQADRIKSSLDALELKNLAEKAPYNDFELKLGCFLDWGLYRERISLKSYPNLQVFLQGIKQYPYFAATTPPPL
ncbi:glutathione S-transferase family protein [Gilvimarinus sp. SDUM040013]|uniref:Glutathione S-transferase family protein n=1 Tax=Gilvimarinus gilvus TaxID=3058038 RepID=A0ABU4S1U9_9GAMM|nr:glutathione S-transferase family protein [Gilvimarinus sp. SDUM040013]MDO3385221.1 glutathione S-transferase family protein [Gilvimarinus sp. SDUM040013]MDX6849204.1 glutathione S-transferase family protein [Gilvimarinus sp. SDUM040013]